MNRTRYAAEELAQFVAELRYDALSNEVKERAKDLILDTTGVALYGSTAPWSIAAQSVAVEPGPCVVIGTRHVTSPGLAALVNGVAAHAYDYDDVHNESITHPAGALVPAILAVGQARRASGKKVLAALVAGYEIVARVGTALVPLHHRRRGFHPTGTCGPFGAAAAAGFLMGLDAQRLTWALGIAGSCASGLMEYWADGSMVKRVHPGLAAQHGILSAVLAAAGFTGPRSIFEGNSGVLKAYTDGAEPQKLVVNLGKEHEILNSQIKLFACRSALHTMLEALLQLRSQHRIDANEISEITVGHVRKDRVSDHSDRPANTLEAQMSLEYTMAVAAYDGAAGPAQYAPEKLADPRVLALASRVKPVFSDELFELFTRNPRCLPSTVEVIMKNGDRYFKRVDYPPDGPGNRSPRETLIQKFRGMTQDAIGREQAERLIESILSLDRLDDVSTLCGLLAGDARRAVH